MGAVAIFYFFAAAFAMAVACCGPDPRAKLCSAYLLGTWALTNGISLGRPTAEALGLFTVPDLVAWMVIWVIFMRWPTRWIAAVLAALSVQVIFQVVHGVSDPLERSDVAAHWVNELMYDVQLIAVCIPTGAQLWRRFRRRQARRPAKAMIPPPYAGWTPPDGP